MKREKEIEAFLKGELPSEEKLKYEIARELGVLDQVIEKGWIGGLMTKRRKKQ